MRSDYAARWAVKLGYANVLRFPDGFQGWTAMTNPDEINPDKPEVGEIFPDARFTILDSHKDADYLDLNVDGKTFTLNNIGVKWLILAVYDLRSPDCPAATAEHNRLFQQINKDDLLALNVKIMGVLTAAPNRAAAAFRRQHKMKFPVFSDKNAVILHGLSEPSLPAWFVLKRQTGDGWRIINLVLGQNLDADNLFQRLKAAMVIAAED